MERITVALESLEPSIVVLSEVKAPRLAEWAERLAGIGLEQQTNTLEYVTAEDPYGVLIASKARQEPQPWITPCPSPNRADRVEIEGISITGIHAPDQPAPARPFYEWLLEEAAPSLALEALLIGDFNADQDGDGISLAQWFAPLVDSGWVHGLRHLQPNGDHSSWWNRGRGFSIDNCLLSPTLTSRLEVATLLDTIGGSTTAGPSLSIRVGALSDHRPLLVDFSPQTGPSGTVARD